MMMILFSSDISMQIPNSCFCPTAATGFSADVGSVWRFMKSNLTVSRLRHCISTRLTCTWWARGGGMTSRIASRKRCFWLPPHSHSSTPGSVLYERYFGNGAHSWNTKPSVNFGILWCLWSFSSLHSQRKQLDCKTGLWSKKIQL